MDVWFTAEVKYCHSGFKFVDSDGNPTTVGYDCKVIHIDDNVDFQPYHEYHMELELNSYRYKYNIPRRQFIGQPGPEFFPPPGNPLYEEPA